MDELSNEKNHGNTRMLNVTQSEQASFYHNRKFSLMYAYRKYMIFSFLKKQIC